MHNEIDTTKLNNFLHEANKSTYANDDSLKVTSSRLKSKDYHYEKEDLTYHDTYFGERSFIGEEIIYKDQKPLWGANYFGFVLIDEIKETDVYSFLRKALIQEYSNIIPVRGPSKFSENKWNYQFLVKGDIKNFAGQEQIFFEGKVVYRCLIHGGIIQ